MSAAYERVAEALERAGSQRRGKLWHCPAHDDRTPSLSLGKSNDGRVIELATDRG